MEIYDNCLHTKYPLMWQIFTFGIIFPPIFYFLLKNVHYCLPWNRWEWCGRHLMRESPPGLGLCRPCLCQNPWASRAHSAIHDNPVPFASLDSLYFVFSSEPPRWPRTGWEQRPRTCVPAVPWPSQAVQTPATQCGLTCLQAAGHRDNPEWGVGTARCPQCWCRWKWPGAVWAQAGPQSRTPWEPLKVSPHVPWQSSLQPVPATPGRDNLSDFHLFLQQLKGWTRELINIYIIRMSETELI